jgi:hypothetical protein
MSNVSPNSRRSVRALIESRPKAGSSVSSGRSCPSGTRTRYLLKMVYDCASFTRCTSFSDGVVAARSAVKRYKLTNPPQGCCYSEHGVLASRRVSGGAGPLTASGRRHPPCICIWVENRGGLFSPSRVPTPEFGTRGPVSAKSFRPLLGLQRLFNHVCTRTSRATRCGSGGRTTIQR